MDIENLGPGPDLENVNFENLDRGDAVQGAETPAAEVKEEAPAETPAAEAKEEASAEAKEEAKEEPAAEAKEEVEQPRDSAGKFAKKGDKDTPAIPKARFDEAVNKEREARLAAEQRAEEAERRFAEARQAQQQQEKVSTTVAELDAKAAELLNQHTQLLLDGEREKAAEVLLEARKIDRQIARLEAETTSAQTTNATIDNQRLNVVITSLERDHDVLNPKSESYDDDLVQTILMWQQKGIAAGLPPSVAMENAAGKVMERFYKTNPPDAEDKEVEEKEGLSEVSKEAEQKKEERQRQAVDKGMKTQGAQPPAANTLGVDSDKLGEKGLPDVSRMSSDEFDALPDTTKARLRGDMV